MSDSVEDKLIDRVNELKADLALKIEHEVIDDLRAKNQALKIDHEAELAEQQKLNDDANKELNDQWVEAVAENQRLREAVKFISDWMESGDAKGRPMDRMTNKQWEKWLELKGGAG